MSEKIKFWRKLSTNKKMIFAIPQIIEMIDMLEQQDKRIAEFIEVLKDARKVCHKAGLELMRDDIDEVLKGDDV